MRYHVYGIEFTDKSKDQFNSYSPKLKKQIASKLEKLSHNPYIGKPLQRPFKGLFSYRLGKLRIIYQIVKKQIVIIILSISFRKESYIRH